MDKIKKFKEFIDRSNMEVQKIRDREKELAKEVIEDFFSEEIKIINDIHDMIVDWEDEGIHFIFDISIRNTHSSGIHDLGRHQKIKFI